MYGVCKLLLKATPAPKDCVTAITFLLRGILAQPGETQVTRFDFSIRQVSRNKEENLQTGQIKIRKINATFVVGMSDTCDGINSA